MSKPLDAVDWHSSIATDFDERYAKSPSFRERFAIWSGLIKTYGGASIDALDAGCGSGILSVQAAKRCRSVVAFDASAPMLSLTRDKLQRSGQTNVTVLEASLPDLQFLGDRRFQLVMSSSVLEYMDDMWLTLDALAQRVEPGGVLLVSFPNGTSLYRKCEALSYRVTGRPKYFAHVKHVPAARTMIKGLEARGFAVEKCLYYAPAPLLSTLARRFGLEGYSDNLYVVAARRIPSPEGSA